MASKRERTATERVVFAIVFVFFAIYALSLLYVLIFCFLNSFKTPTEYFDDSFALPTALRFVNYAKAFRELSVESAGFFQMLFNSFWWAGGHVVFHMGVIIFFAYAIARFRFPGRSALLFLNYICILVTVYGETSATYVYYAELGILDSPLILLSATGAFGSTVMIVMSFMNSLSWGYAEAAEIDGANEFRIFFSVYVPLLMPIIGTLGLVQFINTWNDYMGPLLYMESYPTLASGLYQYRVYSVERKGNYPIYFAGLLLTVTPVLILYTAFSDMIMTNMGVGGLKG